VTDGGRLLLADQRAMRLWGGFAAGPDGVADATLRDTGLPRTGNGLAQFALGDGTAEGRSSGRCLLLGDGRREVLFEDAGQFLGLVDDLLAIARPRDHPTFNPLTPPVPPTDREPSGATLIVKWPSTRSLPKPASTPRRRDSRRDLIGPRSLRRKDSKLAAPAFAQ
jgi:hypothetical protein